MYEIPFQGAFLAGDFYIDSIGRGQKNLLYERQTGNA